MKRILKFGGALLALGMLLASCNMITADSTVSGNSTEQESSNINSVTIGIGSIDNSRTILPADWDETTASKLTYVLLGKKTGESGYTLLKTFSYSELTGGTAIVNLELTIWDLKLIGYITEGTGEKGYETHPCLAKESTGVDFSNGKKTVTFDLKPVLTKEGGGKTEATGSINVSIAWLTDQPKRLEFGIYDSGTATATIVGDKGRTNVIDSLGAPSKKLNKITTAFNGSGSTHNVGWQEDDNVQAGMYKFAAVFYDNDDNENYTGNVIGYYIDYLYVDGGNLSKATVNYGDKFNTIPDNPTWLAVETAFVPQQLTESDTTVNEWYYAKFHWNDNSNNETGFELVITEEGNEDDPYIVNPDSLDSTLKADKWYDGTAEKEFEADNPNTLDAGSTWVVLKLTTTKKYTAKIRAINDFTPGYYVEDTTTPNTEAKFCENLNRNGDGKGRSYAPILGDGKQFGMFTVNYKLDEDSTVVMGSGTTGGEVTNYVVGFNYHSEQQYLMTDSILETPHLVNTNNMFDHWQTTTETDGKKVAMPVIPALNIKNLELEPVWKGRDVLVSVTFPSYADAADVKIAADKNIDNTVTYKFDKEKNASVSVNAGKSLTSPQFALTDSKGAAVTEGNMSTSGSTWKWELTKAPPAGYYCLQITGTYEDPGSGRTLTLCGNVYINVMN